MNEQFKDLLHEQAETITFDTFDAGRIAEAGHQRLRRRRTAVAGGAAVLVLATVFAFNRAGTDDKAVEPAPPSGDAPALSWAAGSTLHLPDGPVELGFEVKAYVETARGHVVVDSTSLVHWVLDGRSQELGSVSADDPTLVADPAGAWVGWVDGNDNSFTVQRFDETTDSSGMAFSSENDDPMIKPRWLAIDGATGYVEDSRGVVRLDLDGGEPEVVLPNDGEGTSPFLGAGGGQLAWEVPDPTGSLGDGPRSLVRIGPSPDEGIEIQVESPERARFSPDGAWVTFETEAKPSTFDTATGEPIDLETDDLEFTTPYAWSDASTLVQAVITEQPVGITLQACALPAGSCEVVATPQISGLADLEQFVVPTGEPVK